MRAPNFASIGDVERFLAHKRPWIQQKVAEQSAQLSELKQRTFANEGCWNFLGQPHQLHVQFGSRSCVHRSEEKGVARCGKEYEEKAEAQLIVTISRRGERSSSEKVASALEQWFKQQAQTIFEQKAARIASHLGVTYSEIRLRKTKTRWGHCTAKGALQFNWLVVQAPEPVVDYLVAHEVCHLVHFNHSRAFWQLVESVCPHYKQSRHWLKTNGLSLWF